MSRIFRYEARRLLISRIYLGLLAINLFYAGFVLYTETILGVGYTAPFSGWSLGAYWASVIPVSIVITLFSLTNYFSPQAKRAETLTLNTPVNRAYYDLTRMAAAALGFGVLVVLLFILPSIFFGIIFNEWRLSELSITAALTVLPCFIFSIGLGYGLARIHYGLLYVSMAVVLLASLIPAAHAFDFFGGGYYASIPLKLAVGASGEPAFAPGIDFVAARGLYLVTGAVLVRLSLRVPKRIVRESA